MRNLNEYTLTNGRLYKWSEFKRAWILISERIPSAMRDNLAVALEWHYETIREQGRQSRAKRR